MTVLLSACKCLANIRRLLFASDFPTPFPMIGIFGRSRYTAMSVGGVTSDMGVLVF